MLPCRCAQILPDSINGGIDKPFAECLHNELCCGTPADKVKVKSTQKEKSRQIFGVLEKNANFAHAIRQWPWIIARKFG